MSIRTICTDGIGRFQSVHDRKIASHLEDLEYFLGFTGVEGVRVVDPYGPYGWNWSFSIRTRSENCISLRGLRIFSRLYRCGGGYGSSIRTVRTDRIGRFQSVHIRKIASH